jgi:hypothetical protein
MSRPLRIQFSGPVYHVMTRGMVIKGLRRRGDGDLGAGFVRETLG